MKDLFTLFATFARIGGFTFGGGYAMLPMLQKEVVERYHWATEEELMDYYAIGQCTPGVIAVNTATFIGYKLYGVIGGIVATLGVIAPSIVIIAVITAFLENFMDYALVQSALAGIRVCVCVLVFNAVLGLGSKSVKDLPGVIVFIAVLLCSLLTDIPVTILVLTVGILGAFLKCPEEGGKKA